MESAELLAQVLPEDLNTFGLIPEFIGRIPVVSSVQDLGEDDLVRILTEPKNALVKQYQRMLGFDNAELEFEPAALHAIAKEAIDRNTGARGLRSICESVRRHHPEGHRHAGMRYRGRPAPGHPPWQAPCRRRGVALACSTGIKCPTKSPWHEAAGSTFLAGSVRFGVEEGTGKDVLMSWCLQKTCRSKMEYPL